MPVTNKQIADIFRKALPNIARNRSCGDEGFTYICWAIEDIPRGGWRKRQAAKNVIMSRLAPYSTMADWLQQQLGTRKFTRVYTYERMQAHRIAWLKQLIEEFSK